MKKLRINIIVLLFFLVSCGNPQLGGFSESPDLDSNNPAQIIDILEGEERRDSSICDLADSLIEECTGVRPPIGSSCSEEDSNAARAILDSGCDTILSVEAQSYSFKSEGRENSQGKNSLCERYGLACEEKVSCNQELSNSDLNELLQLADTRTIKDIADVSSRLERIGEIFVSNQDARGIFSVVYTPITARALNSVNDEIYEDNVWAQKLMIDFAGRYFDNLKGHLTGGKVSREWKRYYSLAQNCSVSRLRVAAAGVSVHLLVDLPFSLKASGSENRHYEDYMNFGDILVAVTPKIIENLDAAYGVDAKDFFNGFFLGKWVDSLANKPMTTRFMFQTIRTKAWRNSKLLKNWFTNLIARGEIFASWQTADGVIQILDGANII